MFTTTSIYELFGAEAAEDETPERLKSYFYKNHAYDSIRSDLPLRILVGHKGSGKSALLGMSKIQDEEDSTLVVDLRPNDVHHAMNQDLSLINQIQLLKHSIANSIFEKSLAHIGVGIDEEKKGKFRFAGDLLVKALQENFSRFASSVTISEKSKLLNKFVDTGKIRIYIDDVDRAWEGGKKDVQAISALLNACRDLANEDRRLQFRIALRTDAYFLYRTFDSSADKIDGSVVRLQWENHEILVVMAKRVAAYFGNRIDENYLDDTQQLEISRHLFPIITERFQGVGAWEGKPIHKILMSFVRRRPRDLVIFLKDSAEQAMKKRRDKIVTVDIQAMLPNYSSERINDLIVEFKSELPQVEKLLFQMRPTAAEMKKTSLKSVYSKDKLLSKLNDIRGGTVFQFSNGQPATAQGLANFLYRIDFIIARKELDSGRIDRKFFDQSRMLQSQFVDFGYAWEIHPAYRWALQPYDANAVLREIAALDP